jgi:carbonic anhydrase
MMGVVESLINGNRTFAASRFDSNLTMRPSLSTTVVTCFDPRVDPAVLFGVEQGEIGVLRNVGGRITPGTVQELLMLQEVAKAAGSDGSTGWEVIVLHHTRCGITLIQDRPDLLSPYLRTNEKSLAGAEVGDPRAAVTHDVAALRSVPQLNTMRSSGLVYDVNTGLVDLVVAPQGA